MSCGESKQKRKKSESKSNLGLNKSKSNLGLNRVAKGEQDLQPGASNMRELVWDDELAAIAQRSNQSLERTISCKVQLIVVVTFKSDRMMIHSPMVNSVLRGTSISCNISCRRTPKSQASHAACNSALKVERVTFLIDLHKNSKTCATPWW